MPVFGKTPQAARLDSVVVGAAGRGQASGVISGYIGLMRRYIGIHITEMEKNMDSFISATGFGVSGLTMI